MACLRSAFRHRLPVADGPFRGGAPWRCHDGPDGLPSSCSGRSLGHAGRERHVTLRGPNRPAAWSRAWRVARGSTIGPDGASYVTESAAGRITRGRS